MIIVTKSNDMREMYCWVKKIKIPLKLLLYFNLDCTHIKKHNREINQNCRGFVLVDRVSVVVIFLFLMLYAFQILQHRLVLLLCFKKKRKKKKKERRGSSTHFPVSLRPVVPVSGTRDTERSLGTVHVLAVSWKHLWWKTSSSIMWRTMCWVTFAHNNIPDAKPKSAPATSHTPVQFCLWHKAHDRTPRVGGQLSEPAVSSKLHSHCELSHSVGI